MAYVICVGNPPFLQMRACRKHVVCKFARFRHEHVVDDKEIEFFKCLPECVTVRH